MATVPLKAHFGAVATLAIVRLLWCTVYAMSVFVVVTALFIKIQAAHGMLSHVQYLRDLFDSRVITAIGWTYTRDMVTGGAAHRSSRQEATAYAHE